MILTSVQHLLPVPCSQVIFCSRTHSQLSQFVEELRRTSFPERLSLVALASRKVLCINQDVRRMGSAGLVNQTCLDMQRVRGRGAGTCRGRCSKKNKIASRKEHSFLAAR